MIDHVAIPALVVLPVLALALLLAVRSVLRPLHRVARQAEALGAAVATGQRMEKLPADRLPLELRQMVEALNAMLVKLELVLGQQRQFTADAAHQLRTPLSVMMLEAAALAPGPATTHIREELEGLARLVNQLLRLAQADAAMAGERHPVDIGTVARRVCEGLAPLAVARGQVIEFDAPERPVAIQGLDPLVDAAVSNLVDNALRHAPPGGTVSVTVADGAEPRVVVEDRGPGVPDAQKRRIFERFGRLGPADGGAGIGLALVQQVAVLHGGHAWVEDRPGGGSRFVLSFAGLGGMPVREGAVAACPTAAG
jgi:signal transduction histidine kinase